MSQSAQGLETSASLSLEWSLSSPFVDAGGWAPLLSSGMKYNDKVSCKDRGWKIQKEEEKGKL